MKKLTIGLAVLATILATIIFFQQDKIKKIWEIKQGAGTSERPRSNFDKRIGEIIAVSKKNQADQKEKSRIIIEEFAKKFLIRCSDLADQQRCENLMKQIIKDEKIILTLEKLNKAGVGVVITWYKPNKNEAIYINKFGLLMIHEEADIQDIKKFFGIN